MHGAWRKTRSSISRRCPFDPAGVAQRDDLGAVALYTFRRIVDGCVLQQASGGLLRHRLVPDQNSAVRPSMDQGIEVCAPTLIRTAGSAAQLCRAIETSQALTVEVELMSADLGQHGPARIVSVSASPYLRNFTLAQERAEVDVRIRTPRMGLNGMDIPMRTCGSVLAGGWHHVAVSYAHGTVRVYVDGSSAPLELRLSTLSYLLFRDHAPVSTGLVLGLVFFTLGVAGTVVFARWRGYLAGPMGFCAASVPALSVAVGATVVLDRDGDVPLIAATILASLIGVAAGLELRRSRRVGFCAVVRGGDLR